MKRIIWALLAVPALALLGCDRDMAYTPGELAIEARFRRIAVGDAEQDVRSHLGDPTCVIYAIAETEEELTAHCPESSPPVRLRIDDRSSWPTDLPGLPLRRPTFKALVYVDSAISAFYLVDQSGRVEFLHVRMT